MEPEYLKHADSIGREEVSELIDQYGEEIWKYAYAITRNAEMAKDVAQETFIKAYYNIHTFRRASSFRTWLLSITRNTAINARRSSYVRRVLLMDRIVPQVTARSAESEYMDRQSAAYIWSVIMGLSRKLREVLILDLEHGLEVREIAALLRISEGTVKSRLYRARRQVEIRMEEE